MSVLLKAPSAQPTELSLLVDLEARWENLRTNRLVNAGRARALPTQLHQIQKAYEAFQSKLSAYNKTFKPAHVPEVLLNTPHRLGEWCRKMRDLFGRLEQSALLLCPAHLMEKAYRSADHIADRLHKEHAARLAPSDNVAAAVRELDSLACWCDNIAPAE